MDKVSDAQKKAVERYRQKGELLQVRLPDGIKDVARDQARGRGFSNLGDYFAWLVKNDKN